MNIEEIGYDNRWYNPGAGLVKRLLWYYVNVWFIKCNWLPFRQPRVWLLRLFGAKIGKMVFIKPGVNIKHPWLLEVDDYAWIGENVFIDNLVNVHIGKKACVSQNTYLMCGNHNYKKRTFDLMVGEIDIQEGAWVGASCTVCPGVTMGPYSILSVGSVASKDLDAYGIYRGNPCVKIKERVFEN